jgi:hypothetical protein
MDPVFDGKRSPLASGRSAQRLTPTLPRTNSVTASQARAARRREARRDEQAVAAWLRELAGRTR